MVNEKLDKKVVIEKEDELYRLLNYLNSSQYYITTDTSAVNGPKAPCVLAKPNKIFIAEKRGANKLEIGIIKQNFFLQTYKVGYIPNLLEKDCILEVYGRKNMGKMEKLAKEISKKYDKSFKIRLVDEGQQIIDLPHIDSNGKYMG